MTCLIRVGSHRGEDERQTRKQGVEVGWEGLEGADSAVRVSFAGRGSRRGDERAAAAGVCAGVEQE